VQAVAVTNMSDKDFTLTCNLSGYAITIATLRQAQLPLFAPTTKFIGTVSGVPNKLIQLQLLNFPTPSIVW